MDNDGEEEKCGAVGLAAGPHAVRVLAFQAKADGEFKATYRCASHPAATT